MNARGGELVTTDEPTIVPESFLGAIMVEDSQGDRRFSDPPYADESDWREFFCEIDDPLDEFSASKTSPWRRRWGFARYARYKYEILGPLTVEITDLG